MKFIGKRLSYANVAMTLALVFAMTSGAYAAKKYLITSTNQISPKVLTHLKGSRGPAGPEGKQGPAGPQGPAGTNGKDGAPGKEGPAGKEGPQGLKGGTGATGPQGLQGVKGDTGAQGLQGVKGDTGPQGPEGSPWTAGGTLPSKETETGVFASPKAGKAGEEGNLPLSFSIPLKSSAYNINLLGPEEFETENCPGTANDPQAKPGQLCVYTLGQLNATLGPSSLPFKSGALVGYTASEAGGLLIGGWAVTAP